jgi:hypothetical protein
MSRVSTSRKPTTSAATPQTANSLSVELAALTKNQFSRLVSASSSARMTAATTTKKMPPTIAEKSASPSQGKPAKIGGRTPPGGRRRCKASGRTTAATLTARSWRGASSMDHRQVGSSATLERAAPTQTKARSVSRRQKRQALCFPFPKRASMPTTRRADGRRPRQGNGTMNRATTGTGIFCHLCWVLTNPERGFSLSRSCLC